MAGQASIDRLERIADSIPKNILSGIEPLPFDRWLCKSALQKGVRRGDTSLAARATLTLHGQDKNALWRRLGLIAVEDVAMGCLETTRDVLAACKSALWRKKVGSAALAVYLARRMAKVAKTRWLTELYIYTDLSSTAVKAHTWAAKASSKELASILHDPAIEAHKKALAIWGLFGSRRVGTQNFQRTACDLDEAIKAIKAMPVPEDILEVCTSAISAPHFLLSSLLPIGWLEMQKQAKALNVVKEMPVSSPMYKGLPLVAVDGLYTRVGIASIKELKKAVSGLAHYTNAQIGETLFFIEGENLNPRLTCPTWVDFRQTSILALMESLGLDSYGYQALQRCLIRHYDLYGDIRLEKLASLPEPQADMFT